MSPDDTCYCDQLAAIKRVLLEALSTERLPIELRDAVCREVNAAVNQVPAWLVNNQRGAYADPLRRAA